MVKTYFKEEKVKLTKKQKDKRFALLIDMGCVVCKWYHDVYTYPEIHHVLDCGRRVGDHATYGLCTEHHRGGKRGVSRHPYRKAFEEAFMPESDILEKVNEEIDDKS